MIGPGLILAASIVGTGELINTTGLGAKAGFSLLWLIVLSCVIKVFVQVELGRYAITHGKTTLAAFGLAPRPPRAGASLVVLALADHDVDHAGRRSPRWRGPSARRCTWPSLPPRRAIADAAGRPGHVVGPVSRESPGVLLGRSDHARGGFAPAVRWPPPARNHHDGPGGGWLRCSRWQAS